MSKKDFDGVFRTVKLDKGQYELFFIQDVDGKEVETKIGEQPGLTKCKDLAGQYVMEKDKEATHYKMIHHKPGREKDAKETRSIKSLKLKTS